jgi:uncharacterized protein (DUF1778 family)
MGGSFRGKFLGSAGTSIEDIEYAVANGRLENHRRSKTPGHFHDALGSDGWFGGHASLLIEFFERIERWKGNAVGKRGQPELSETPPVDIPVAKWHHDAMQPLLDEPRTRITARVSDKMRATLEQAAELMGATVNQFVVQTAYQEAQRLIERESVIRLSQNDARKILSLLDDPPKPNKRLKDAVKQFKGTMGVRHGRA